MLGRGRAGHAQIGACRGGTDGVRLSSFKRAPVMKSRPILLAVAALCLILCRSASAQTVGNAWHIPDNSSDVGVNMSDPQFWIGPANTWSK